MAFYNRFLAQPVQKFVDLFGKVQPLDVVQYGGVSAGSATIANLGTTQILAAPPAGFSWRLHSWGRALGASATDNGAAAISDANGSIDGFQNVATNTVAVVGRQVNGQVATGAVSITNFLGLSATFFVRYDQITTPSIS